MEKALKAATASQGGFTVEEFARHIRLSRAALYALPDELKPKSVLFGRRRVVIEQPDAYLQRVAALQDVA